MSKCIGIDLGTGTSEVAVMENGQATIIANSEGDRTTPSIVAYKSDGTTLVGKAAKNQAAMNPKGTVYAIKRFIGHTYDEMGEWPKIVPYKVVKNQNNMAYVEINGKTYSPEQISAEILMKMKKTAEDYTGEKITDAVITVPAYFNSNQKQATMDAGKIAGLNVLRLVAEPTAAALAFGFDKKGLNKKIAVVDAGSGTEDVSILDVADGVFEVLATSGDAQLGGTDFDNKIVDWIIDDFKKNNGIDLSKDSTAMQRIKDAAEQAKITLSNQTTTNINIPFITADQNGPKHLSMDLTRAKFESLCSDLIERHKKPMKQAVEDANLKMSDIDEVLLIGGTTRIPAIQNAVKEVFGKEGNKSINPDEAVAMGAAIQAGVLSGTVKQDIVLLDVTPLTLGIETVGGVMTPLIPKNTTIPTKKSQVFSTAADGQTAVTIHVLQGERPMAKDNKSLGQFNLDGIPAAPRGVPQIEVSFDIDSNSIVTVTAKDLGTNKEQHITITGNGNLSKEDIDKMIKDAEAHADEDKKLKETADAKNDAEATVNTVEKQIKDYGDKVSADEKKKAEDALNALKEAQKKDDIEDLKKKTQECREAAMAIGQKMYESAQQASTANAGNSSASTSGTSDDGTSYTVHDDNSKSA